MAGLDHEFPTGKLRALAGLMRSNGFVRKPIKLSSLDVLFNLTVPLVRVKLTEPFPERREFGTTQFLDFLLKLFDLGHNAPHLIITSPPP